MLIFHTHLTFNTHSAFSAHLILILPLPCVFMRFLYFFQPNQLHSTSNDHSFYAYIGLMLTFHTHLTYNTHSSFSAYLKLILSLLCVFTLYIFSHSIFIYRLHSKFIFQHFHSINSPIFALKYIIPCTVLTYSAIIMEYASHTHTDNLTSILSNIMHHFYILNRISANIK